MVGFTVVYEVNEVAENRSSESFVEGTQFYKKSAILGVLKQIVIFFVVFIVLVALIGWAAIDAGARQAYKEARDIRMALRAVGTQYYAGSESIYNPYSATGLSEGAAERIQQISTRKGDVLLYSWDDEYNVPLQFEYRKGLYRVMYVDEGLQNGNMPGTEGDYVVYYSFEVLSFEAS